MAHLEKTDVENLLRTFIDPNHGVDLVTAKSVKAITIDGANVSVKLELGYPAKSTIDELKSVCRTAPENAGRDRQCYC